MIDFSKEELDYLSPISKYHKLEEPFLSTYNKKFKDSDVKVFFIQTRNNEFRIYKFDDEWYLIKHKEWVLRPNGIDDDVIWKYYKCDTFDGVKQFFMEIKSSKLNKMPFFRRKTYEGLFNFFNKKPIETPPVDILYEPITSSYMAEYEDNHQTIPFTKEENVYIKGLVKDPSKLVYKSGSVVLSSINFQDLFSINKNNKKEFLIKKYDDEWFFIIVFDPKIKDINWRNKYSYYKCDTFDGVKQFFMEIKSSKLK